jgi:hypothetical protein
MLTYEELKENPADFLCATGLTVSEFEQLLPRFEPVYARKHGGEQPVSGQPRQRKAGGGAKGTLASSADKLLFILVYEKTYPLQTMHGLAFGLSQERANEWIQRLLPVLQAALNLMGLQPVREARALAAHDQVPPVPADLILDGTERRQQRPQDQQQQGAQYSAKKNAYAQEPCSDQPPNQARGLSQPHRARQNA